MENICWEPIGENVIKINELWKPVKGFEDFYRISDQGRLQSLDRRCWNGKAFFIREGKIMSGSGDKDGYKYCKLFRKDSTYSVMKIHRLVAFHFIPWVRDKSEVNHINELKDDNRRVNLEWCTGKENCNHSNAKDFTITDPDGKMYSGRNIKDFAKENGLDATCLTRVINGKRKSHKGWKCH